MERLHFTIEDKAIAELFGRQNFSTKESAVFELIKNSYDAGATVCEVSIDNDYIKIIDNGNGMDADAIKENWMHVGSSDKDYKDEVTDRVLAGSKGVGRFALARLGDRVEVRSKKEKKDGVFWKTDWLLSELSELFVATSMGTEIQVFELRDKWYKRDIDQLIDFLSRAYIDDSMKIDLRWKGERQTIVPIFSDLELGKNYTASIYMEMDKKGSLIVKVKSDEFKEEVQQIIGSSVSINSFNDSIEVLEDVKFTTESEVSYKELISELGLFKVKLFFSLGRTTLGNSEKFMYKHQVSDEKKDTGIILYRNAFSISSMEGKKDWLQIAARARKSPAAATHPSGSWRVRSNQLFGYVEIDKEENRFLVDLANRQGLDENEHYHLFIDIISEGLDKFESYRQSIIREISKYNYEQNKKNDDKVYVNLDKFLRTPTIATKMDKEELKKLSLEMKEVKQQLKEEKKSSKETEQQLKYDVRILNVLATQGLRASSIAHELHNKRNLLSSGYTEIVDALKNFGYWDELNSTDKTKYAFQNVPELLSGLEKTNVRVGAFMDVMLNKIEKNKFLEEISSVEEVLESIIQMWSSEYSWVRIKFKVVSEYVKPYTVTKDVLEVILDNLILNSVQHNELKNSLSINIQAKMVNDKIYIEYSDDGVGLKGKFIRNPRKILDVHQSSRDEGHGLGMWIVNSTIDNYGGEITDIQGKKGFSIKFNLKG